MFNKIISFIVCRIKFYAVLSFLLGRKSILHPSSYIEFGAGKLSIGSGVSVKRRVLLACKNGDLAIGDGVWVNDDVEINSYGKISIGRGTTVQRRTAINGNVVIGEQCIIAPNVFISSGTHPFDRYPGMTIRDQERQLESEGGGAALDRPVIIGDDVWLGVNVAVLPGVKIGSHSVIGANSVVTKDVEPFCVMAGVPAKIIRRRS